MGTTFAIIAIFIMLGYLTYLFAKSTKTSVKNRMYICIGLVIWCSITAITYFIEGKIGSGFIWLFNTGLWIFNTHINNRHYESISEYKSMSEPQDKQTVRKKKLERILSGNPFKSFINWLKK